MKFFKLIAILSLFYCFLQNCDNQQNTFSGLQDIFFTGNEVTNRLYLNKGDGWLDIYVSQDSHYSAPANSRQNLLYINNKNDMKT